MWLATENDATNEIVVYYGDAPYSSWNGPITLATGVHDDDIAVVAALPNKVMKFLLRNLLSMSVLAWQMIT
jgi:hypothetical protein